MDYIFSDDITIGNMIDGKSYDINISGDGFASGMELVKNGDVITCQNFELTDGKKDKLSVDGGFSIFKTDVVLDDTIIDIVNDCLMLEYNDKSILFSKPLENITLSDFHALEMELYNLHMSNSEDLSRYFSFTDLK